VSIIDGNYGHYGKLELEKGDFPAMIIAAIITFFSCPAYSNARFLRLDMAFIHNVTNYVIFLDAVTLTRWLQ